jgi:hypothetical protein
MNGVKSLVLRSMVLTMFAAPSLFVADETVMFVVDVSSSMA